MRNIPRCNICKRSILAGESLFRVPSDERRRIQWSQICQKEISPKALICQDHFLPSDIMVGAKRKNLMPRAVPCLRLFAEVPKAANHAGASCSSTKLTQLKKDICPQGSMDIDISTGPALTLPVKTVRYTEAYTQTETTILQRQLEKYKAMNENLQAEIKELKRMVETKHAVITFMKTIFTEGQMKQIMTPGQVRWGRNDISNAIRLHATGPKAYNYMLKKGFPLPPASTLEFWCRKVVIKEGFLTTSLGFMKHCMELSSEDKMCVLAFDKMKVEQENVPEGDSNRKHYVQVVVAQGLWKSWKRPVFFDFDCEMKKDVLCSIITELYKASFPVVAIVCDLKPTNRELWQELGVTTDKPWFPSPVNPEEKIFTFVDPPLLLDLIRNQFLGTGLMWNNELLTSRTIADAIKHTSNSSTSITFDLTDEHLSVKTEGGQKLAEQLFSNTTAMALMRCCPAGMNLYKTSETADFIQFINDWFGILNSSIDSFTTRGKEPFGIALADQQRILSRMNVLMSAPIIPNKTTLENFQEGVIITNTALVLLHDYIKQKFGMTYVLTGRINQHQLKHLIDAIRIKGGLEENLTPMNFKMRLKKYILAQNLIYFHGTNNMETDGSSSNALANISNAIKLKVTNENDADHQLQHEVLDKIVADRNPNIGNIQSDTTNMSSTTSTLMP